MRTTPTGTHALAYQAYRDEALPRHCGGRHQDGSACEEHLHAEVVA